jgi:YggT family protein
MPSSYFTNPLVFIIDVLFGLYILAVMLRFLLQWFRADFYNPLAQVLIKVTNPPLKPLRRIIPGVAGLDMAAVLLMLVLQTVALTLITMVQGVAPSIPALLVLACGELLTLLINVFIFAIIIQVIISWVNPGAYNPAVGLLYTLTEPVMRPARRVIPPIGGLDLSPLLVILVLQVAKMLLIPPISKFAAILA